MYSLNLGVILCARSGAEHQPHLVHSPRISAALLNLGHPSGERALVKVQYSFRGSPDQDSGIDEFLFSDLDFVQLLTCKTRSPQHLHTNKWTFNSQDYPVGAADRTKQSHLHYHIVRTVAAKDWTRRLHKQIESKANEGDATLSTHNFTVLILCINCVLVRVLDAVTIADVSSVSLRQSSGEWLTIATSAILSRRPLPSSTHSRYTSLSPAAPIELRIYTNLRQMRFAPSLL